MSALPATDLATTAEAALLAMVWAHWPGHADILALPEHFFMGEHRALFVAMRRAHAQHEPILPMTIQSLMQEGGLSAEQAAAIVARTQGVDSDPAELGRAMAIVAGRNKEHLVSKELTDAIAHGSPRDLAARVDGLLGQLKAMDALVVPQVETTTLAEAMATIHAPQSPTFSSGFGAIDRLMGNGEGLPRGEVTILAAEAGVGKSALTATIGQNIAMTRMGQVVYATLEMDARSIAIRLAAAQLDIPVNAIEIANQHESARLAWLAMSGEEQAAMAEPPGATAPEQKMLAAVDAIVAGGGLGREGFHFLSLDRNGRVSVDTIIQQVRALNRRARRQAERVALVVIDYLQILDYETQKNESDAKALERLSMVIKGLAESERVHIICISSLNRSQGGSDASRIRNSGAIEFAADNIVMMAGSRDFLFDAEQQGLAKRYADCTVLKLRNVKHRKGASGLTEYLQLRRPVQRIAEVPGDERDLVVAAIAAARAAGDDDRPERQGRGERGERRGNTN